MLHKQVRLYGDKEQTLAPKPLLSHLSAQDMSTWTAQHLGCVMCSPLLGMLRELERLYSDAEQTLVGKPVQAQLPAEAGSAAAARAALFDDDLDLHGPDRNNAGRQACRTL
jgi:hypothetical protein